MKTITAPKHLWNMMEGYDDIAIGEHFIYRDCSYSFEAIKLTDKYSAFINAWGRYILAKRYLNCLSIGSSFITEYDTLDKLIDKNHHKLTHDTWIQNQNSI